METPHSGVTLYGLQVYEKMTYRGHETQKTLIILRKSCGIAFAIETAAQFDGNSGFRSDLRGFKGGANER